MVTIFENIYADKPNFRPVEYAIERIRTGRSRGKIEEIRNTLDKNKADLLKRQLPSVCFSGKFSKRVDEAIEKHSGFIVLDFDEVKDLREKQTEIISNPFVYACWVSPRGNGLKALVRLADGTKHREHFQALRDVFPDADRSGINPSRVCYESFDPEIYVNPDATAFTQLKKTETVELKEVVSESSEIFLKLLKWLTNRNDAFVTGERNIFIFKLASACCRFGLGVETTQQLIANEFLTGATDFSIDECKKAIRSAYKANKQGTAVFERDVLIDKVSRSEVTIADEVMDPNVRPKDVIYGQDVKPDAIEIYRKGYPYVEPVGIPDLDRHYKAKRGEITLLSGIGNYGKSAFKKWYSVLRAVLFGEKFAIFCPEDHPPQEYFHDLTEILLGCDCTPKNHFRPSIEQYNNAYDFICSHFFYVYPAELAPTPEYIKERFLELIIKEKVDWVVIDPFNQMTNDYKGAGGRTDKYLETFLADFSRFVQSNNVYGLIIAHPKLMRKEGNGNYPCPDVFDLADGAMWNNKMDNILIYHRPQAQVDPANPECELHSKKIKRQKIVGEKGFIVFELNRPTRRFRFSGKDYLHEVIQKRGLSFVPEQTEIFTKEWRPTTDLFEPEKKTVNGEEIL